MISNKPAEHCMIFTGGEENWSPSVSIVPSDRDDSYGDHILMIEGSGGNVKVSLDTLKCIVEWAEEMRATGITLK